MKRDMIKIETPEGMKLQVPAHVVATTFIAAALAQVGVARPVAASDPEPEMTAAAGEEVGPQGGIKASDLPAIGQPLGVGTFFARHYVGDKLYALAFMDRENEINGAWGQRGTLIEGADSFVDGVANTAAMLAAGSPIARKVNIDAGDYIPSYVEQALLLAYHKANPGSGLTGWHWGSTQYSANLAYGMDFGDGWQNGFDKGSERPVRLVRRFLIQ